MVANYVAFPFLARHRNLRFQLLFHDSPVLYQSDNFGQKPVCPKSSNDHEQVACKDSLATVVLGGDVIQLTFPIVIVTYFPINIDRLTR